MPGRKMWRRSCLGLIAALLVLAGGLTWLLRKPSLPHRPLTNTEQAFSAQLSAAGAKRLQHRGDPDGGVRFNGELEGRAFALAVPANWNHQALIFAGGYSIPGSALTIPEDPIAEDPTRGLLQAAYRDGFAVGIGEEGKQLFSSASSKKRRIDIEILECVTPQISPQIGRALQITEHCECSI